MSKRLVSISLVVAAIGLLGFTPPTASAAAPAGAAPEATRYTLPPGTLRTKYGMKVLGMKVGEPEIHLGPLEATKDGRSVRKLRFQAGTWGKLRRLYPFDTTSISIIDGATHLPLRTVIKTLRGKQEKSIDLRFKGEWVKGKVTENGKVTPLDERHAPGMVDTISSSIWLAARDLKPGEVSQAPHHSGRKRYWLWFEAKPVEEVRVPAGTFEALPVVCSLYTWKEGQPGPTKKPAVEPFTVWTAWVGRDAERTPIKLLATVSILGDVVVELEARRLK